MADNKNFELFEDIEIPDRLKPDNIAKMLEESKNTTLQQSASAVNSGKITSSVKPKQKKMKIFATIAAGAVLIVGIATAFKLNQNDYPYVSGKDFDFSTELKIQEDYSNIYSTIKQINANANKTKFSFFNFSSFFGVNKNSSDDKVLENDYLIDESATQSNDYSTTHQQVQGVDEADIIKTDGDYIYYVGMSSLYIVKSDGGNLSLVSKLERDGTKAKEIYLKDNKLILVSLQTAKTNSTETADEYHSSIVKRDTFVEIIDLADKANPKIVSSYSQNGEYISSRLIDNNLYISTNYSNTYNEPIKDEREIEKYIPSYTINDNKTYIKADDICIPEKCPNTSYTVVAGLDINSSEMLVSIKALLGFSGTVYGSKDNYYIAGVRYDTKKQTTAIARFSVKNGEIEHTGFCEVNGAVSDQFAMDEYNGYFRIATTSIDDNRATSNNVFVLDKDLKIVGKLEDLAKKETIQSVRFENDEVYLVTFRKTDPLFKIDLSNPEKPKVLSELKINGYSSYLINYGEGKLLGFGVDADDDGRQTGLKLSMFSKDDNGDVKEIVSKSLGTDLKNADSTGIYDHKALLIDETKNIIGIPVTFYDGIDTCNRYYLYKYTDADGFVEIGKVETHDLVGAYSFIRGMYIGDKVYIFSQERIICAGISDAKVISSIDLVTPDKVSTHNVE